MTVAISVLSPTRKKVALKTSTISGTVKTAAGVGISAKVYLIVNYSEDVYETTNTTASTGAFSFSLPLTDNDKITVLAVPYDTDIQAMVYSNVRAVE